jgi:hypothetical protein
LRAITTRRALWVAATAAALGAFLLPLTGTALAVPTPDTITSAFTPTTIGVGGTGTLVITITDTNTSGTDSNITFTDTLPAGLVIDSQNGESGSCGSTAATPVTANPGSSTISLTGGSLKGGVAGSSSATCAVSVDVTSNTVGNYSNAPGAVTSSDGTGTAGAAETLTVAGAPTVSGVSPANNSTFKYGQKVPVTFTCAEGEFGPGLSDCSGFDLNGNTILSGGTVDTTVVGSGQLIEIDATSEDELQTSAFINYTVLPNNVFTVVKTSAGKNGSVTLKLKVPGAGKLVVGEKVDGKAFSSYSGKVNGAKTVTITLKPGSAAKKLLAKIAEEAKNKRPKLTGKLAIAYTPKGGKKKTASVGGIKLKS